VAAKLVRAGIDPIEAVEILEATGGREEKVLELLQERDPVAAAKFLSLLDITVKSKKGVRVLRTREIVELLRFMGVSGLTSEEVAKGVEKIIRVGMKTPREDTVRCLALGEAVRRRLQPRESIFCLTEEEIRAGDFSLVGVSLLGDELLRGVTEGYVKVYGLRNPFVPYAVAYVSRTPDAKRWLAGLFRYLRSPFLDRPSIFLPPFVDEEIREGLEEAILWSPDGPVVSEIPVYSFGRVKERRVLDVVEIDVERLDMKREGSMEEVLRALREDIEAYARKKKELVGEGSVVVVVEGYEHIFKGMRVVAPGEAKST